MTDILKYNKAIRRADLPYSKKVILFVLSSLADPKTGIIPDRFQPGFTKLAKHAGLGRSTVARNVPELESEGWFKKSAPSLQAAWQDKETNSYLLTIPVSMLADLDDELVPDGDQSQSGTSPDAGLVPERDAETPDSKAGLVPERDRTSPGAGHELTPSNPTTKNLSSSAAPSKDNEGPKAKTRKAPKAEPYRDDVEEICSHFADRVVANGSPRPAITDAWRKAARLLLDDKNRPEPLTVKKINALITWSQNHHHWRSRARALPKFRTEYDAIRLQALSEWERQQRGGGRRTQPHQNPDDQSVYDEEL